MTGGSRRAFCRTAASLKIVLSAREARRAGRLLRMDVSVLLGASTEGLPFRLSTRTIRSLVEILLVTASGLLCVPQSACMSVHRSRATRQISLESDR
jgi:hypothetical protein